MAQYQRIRDLREDHDLTQRALAEILRMPQPQYNRYERGLRDIPTDILIQLADLIIRLRIICWGGPTTYARRSLVFLKKSRKTPHMA